MNFDQKLIDDIVKGVLQQLQPTTAPGASSDGAVSGGSALLIEDKLWTADLLEDRVPMGTTCLRQLPGTVVTPSGRDFLRDHRIEVITAELDRTTAVPGRSRWKVLVVDSGPAFESVWNEMTRAGAINWSRQRADHPEAAATESISILARAEAAGVIVLTKEPEQVACLANRHNQVRAVATNSATRLAELGTKLKPNAVCFDPTRLSYMELRQLWRAIH